MNTRHLTITVVLVAAASGAFAQGLTREQVRAELALAKRNGDLLEASGLRDKDVCPGCYRADPAAQGETREQVRAELAQAQRNGTLLEASGLRDNEICPGCYSASPPVQGESREQVKAELATAIRDGDMLIPGRSGLTEYQLQPGSYEGQRAADHANAAALEQGISQAAVTGE